MPDPTPNPPDSPFESIAEIDAPGLPPRPAVEGAEYLALLRQTADKLATDGVGRGDLKLLATALKELRYCLKVFRPYKGVRKVTVFGSARTPPTHPAYHAAEEYSRRMAAAGWMVMTGAAAGIMEAGHVGAGRDKSFGLNIILPFESGANRVIHGDPKLMNLRYFFTRKLMFIKESDAVALFPGGFGTHDEAFETLTLIQTGKSHIFPVVLVDEPGGTYWNRWREFVEEDLLARGYISPSDRSLYRIVDSVEDAVEEVTRFYRVYHSMRYVRGDLVLRLQRPLSEPTLARLRAEFTDIVAKGTFQPTGMLPQEANEPAVKELPRLRFRFTRHGMGRLRELIDVVNGDGPH